MNDRIEMVEKSEKAVLTSRMFSFCKDGLRRGYTTAEEMKNVDAIFTVYTNYRLNGVAMRINNDYGSVLSFKQEYKHLLILINNIKKVL